MDDMGLNMQKLLTAKQKNDLSKENTKANIAERKVGREESAKDRKSRDKAKKIKEVAKEQPKIARAWEEAKKGNTSVSAVYNKAKATEQPPKTVYMDDKMINRYKAIHKDVRLRMRQDLLLPYSENTKNICKKYARMIVNHITNEFKLGGIIDGI